MRRFILATFLISAALFGCRGRSPEDLSLQISKLQSQSSAERNAAALRIAKYGEEGKPAVRGLTKLLADENYGVRSSAAYALRSIATPEAQKALDSYKD